MKKLGTRLTVAVSGLAMSMAAGAGIAAADPIYGAMTDTTCSYEQAMAAVHAENPMAAEYLDKSPANLQFLQTYMASSPEQRVNLLNQIKNNKGANQALPIFRQMMTSCTSY